MRLPSRLAGAGFALTAFAILTCAVLRAVHHYVGVDWDGHAMFDSRLAQAAVSITWAITGVGLMIFGNRRFAALGLDRRCGLIGNCGGEIVLD